MEKTGIFYIGNPLLDISCELKDSALLEKYNLQKGQASLATPEVLPLYDELWARPGREAIPGGSALNSARATNFMLKNLGSEGRVTYYGSIGKDEKGEVLERDLVDNGITGNFSKDESNPTGTCAVLVVDKERTLVANLAAACNYNIEHLRANMESLRKAKIIYSTSFFITSNKEALLEVGKFASDNNVPFGFNLSAVFLIQFELATVLAALEHADYVFANEDEADAFATSQKIEGGRAAVANALSGWKKSNSKRQRVAIITQGPLPVLVSINGEIYKAFESEPLTPEQIVDTNGAGDSFVGGFMAQLLLDQPLDKCVAAGQWLAQQVVQQSGCQFPADLSDFTLGLSLVDKALKDNGLQYAKNSIPEKCLFKYRKDNMVREDDFVIFYESKDIQKQEVMRKGGHYSNREGKYHFKNIMNTTEFGSKVYSQNMKGYLTLVRPNTHMYSASLMQRTQILYTPDISMITSRLGLLPGMRVVESGTGTGSLSTSILKTIFPEGHLYTFEFNLQRKEKAHQDFLKLGINDYVTVTHRDVLSNGFLLDDKVTPNSIDACFLDLPSPEVAVKHAYQILGKKGRLCNFSPCIEQVQKVTQEMATLGFYDIRTFECLSREILQESFQYMSIFKNKEKDENAEEPSHKNLHPKKDKNQSKMKEAANKRKMKQLDKEMKPVSTQQAEMRGHTGYLTFAIKF